MVTVSGFKEIAKKDGGTFISLELSGALELIQSQTTGNWYATVRKVRIPSTFDETIAKIERVTVPPYEFLNKTTGELMTLQHSYTYRPKGAVETIGQTQVMEMA